MTSLFKIPFPSKHMTSEEHPDLDLTNQPFPECQYFKPLTPLDQIIARLPSIPEDVLKHLWSDFVPDKFAPTPYLKDVPPPYCPKPKRYLDLKNPHPHDSRIVFIGEHEEHKELDGSSPHRYYIDGCCRYIISVTTILKAFFEQFDAVKQSESTFNSKTFATSNHRPSYEYYGCKSPADIRACWTRGANLGTMLHANIESYFNKEKFTICKENEIPFEQFRCLFSDTDWVQWEPFRTEWSIFDPETLVAGQIDMTGMMNRDRGEVVLLDWKRCKDINDQHFSRFRGDALDAGCIGKGPCQELENCKFIHYSLQLNFYAYILQKMYGLRTVKRYIIQFHPKNANGLAGVYSAPNLMHIVEEMMACRKLVLRKHGIVT